MQLVLHARQRAEHIGVEGGGIALGRLLRCQARLAFAAGVLDGCGDPAVAGDGLVDQFADLVVITNRRGLVDQTVARSEEHTSELQSQSNLVCRLLLEKKKINNSLSTSTQRYSSITPHNTKVSLRPPLPPSREC